MLALDTENLQIKYVITRMCAMEVAKEAKDQKAEARKALLESSINESQITQGCFVRQS